VSAQSADRLLAVDFAESEADAPSAMASAPWAEAQLGQAEFARLAAFIHDHCGIRCPPGKRTMLEARLRRRLRALGLGSFVEYCKRVLGPAADRAEIVQMVNEVTTNKTDFFREAQHFDYLVNHALPALLDQRVVGSTRPLGLWSAGCSTGEEVYTLAMVLESHSDSRGGLPYGILGSDISTNVLQRAHRAVYDEKLIAPIPFDLRRRFLLQSKDRSSGLVRVVPALRSKVRFARINLLEELSVDGPFEVIFCRNVFIYFDRPTQLGIIQRFCTRLVPGGFLFLGHSDSITGLNVPLTQVAPTVYRKGPERPGR
jgi:chemotaxis protein methyltransferase CheR